MKRTKHLLFLTMAVVVMLVIASAPLTAQQEGDRRAPAQDRQSPPTIQEDSQRQNSPGNYSAADDGVSDVDRADTGLSWGMPILTLLGGLAIGYFIGKSRQDTTPEIRRDRTDRAA